MLVGLLAAVAASAAPAAAPVCRGCNDNSEPVFCGAVQHPAVEAPLVVTWCRGESPAMALRAACDSNGGCGPGLAAAFAKAFMLHSVGRRTRAALGEVPRWMPPKERTLSGSNIIVAGNINYGVSAEVEALLDKPVGLEISYTDVLAWLLLSLSTPRYLEIGVSVGKNLHRMLHAAAAYGGGGESVIGLDLEPISPRLEALYPPAARLRTWLTPALVDGGERDGRPAPASSLKHDAESTLDAHEWPGGGAAAAGAGADTAARRFHYLSGDLKCGSTWSVLQAALEGGQLGGGRGIDLVFSDAWHSQAAVAWELQQLLDRGLLSERAVVVWDDLNDVLMVRAFHAMCLVLMQHHPAVGASGAQIQCALSAMGSGWLATNTSDLIGLAGPADVLRDSGVELVLPTRLRFEDWGMPSPKPSPESQSKHV